jgi:hypothetical protein
MAKKNASGNDLMEKKTAQRENEDKTQNKKKNGE